MHGQADKALAKGVPIAEAARFPAAMRLRYIAECEPVRATITKPCLHTAPL
jgi:hypothetical protein